MNCTLLRADVAATLKREHEAAKATSPAGAAQSMPGLNQPAHKLDFRTSEIHRVNYLAIGPQMGRFLYNTARAVDARHIVEFGTSFGISTMYLAAAAADSGGRVVGSEFHPNKAEKARANLADAGLSDLVEIRVGDALETLADVAEPIDLLFLDGSKDLYLEILKMLEDRLKPGSLVICDNADHLPQDGSFMQYVGEKSPRYLTTLVGFKKGLASYSLVLV
ncbi:MAG: class I SAM-dependent methyltransferase [Rhizobiaceae bacterium]|nr:class I SAM-dependent methyltransferase [Rhizobiaceae bacterium]